VGRKVRRHPQGYESDQKIALELTFPPNGGMAYGKSGAEAAASCRRQPLCRR
jgi:hypothetical protein